MRASGLLIVDWRPISGRYCCKVLVSHLTMSCCMSPPPISLLKCMWIVERGASALWPRLGRGRSVCPSPGNLKPFTNEWMCHLCSCGISIQIVLCEPNSYRLSCHEWSCGGTGRAGGTALGWCVPRIVGCPNVMMVRHLRVCIGAFLPATIIIIGGWRKVVLCTMSAHLSPSSGCDQMSVM